MSNSFLTSVTGTAIDDTDEYPGSVPNIEDDGSLAICTWPDLTLDETYGPGEWDSVTCEPYDDEG